MVEKKRRGKRKKREPSIRKHGKTVRRGKSKVHINIRVCPICGGRHTKNEHRFHGDGSFARTHLGTGRRRKR